MHERFSVDILSMPEISVNNYVHKLRDVFICDNQKLLLVKQKKSLLNE